MELKPSLVNGEQGGLKVTGRAGGWGGHLEVSNQDPQRVHKIHKSPLSDGNEMECKFENREHVLLNTFKFE